jgi:hypothetical protein
MQSPRPFPRIHLNSHRLYDQFAKVISIIPMFASVVNLYNRPKSTIVARWLWVLSYLVNVTKSFVVIWFYHVHLSNFAFSKCLTFNIFFPNDQYNSKVFQGVICTTVVPILPYQTIILFITKPFLNVVLTQKNVFFFHCTLLISWWASPLMSNHKDLLLREVWILNFLIVDQLLKFVGTSLVN